MNYLQAIETEVTNELCRIVTWKANKLFLVKVTDRANELVK